MISLRQHVVSLAAVFLALAVGVVLGGGPLSEVGRGEAVRASTTAGEEGSTGFGDAFATAVATKVVRKQLEDRDVALLALPGADAEVVEALRTRVSDAGGRVVGRYALGTTLLEPGEKQLVDTLGSQLMTQYGKGDVDRGAPTYERLGQLLALAAATPDSAGRGVGPRARSVRDSLAGGDLLATEGRDPRRRAPLVLLVLGDEPVDAVLSPEETGSDIEGASAEAEAATDAVLGGLLAGLRAGSAGVLLAAPTDSGVDGVLARLREDDALGDVSTLDGVETTVGQVSVPLALRRSLDGAAGSFGASGADGAVPLG